MKKIIVVLLGMFSLFAHKATAQAFPVDTLLLNKAYDRLMAQPNNAANQKAFFDAFPSSWEEFFLLYQYPSSKYLEENYDLTMYSAAYKHIEALEKHMTLINDTLYCEKLIQIALGGVHDADAPTYLQMLLKKTMSKKSDVMFHTISRLRPAFQMQFWQFYWACERKITPSEAGQEQLTQKYNKQYPQEVKTMQIAFDYFCGGVPNIAHGVWK